VHDLVDAYSRSIAAAVGAARSKRQQAARLFDEALDHISADFEADVEAAGAALEAGKSAREAAYRGEVGAADGEAQKQAELESEPYVDEAARALADRDQANARLEFGARRVVNDGRPTFRGTPVVLDAVVGGERFYVAERDGVFAVRDRENPGEAEAFDTREIAEGYCRDCNNKGGWALMMPAESYRAVMEDKT
jgi:hypothetical protein